MKIVISPRAEKNLRKLSKFDQLAVAQKIRKLQGSDILGEEKLSGFSHAYRVGVGNYRIVYKKTTDIIYIVLIGHRRDIYRALQDLLR